MADAEDKKKEAEKKEEPKAEKMDAPKTEKEEKSQASTAAKIGIMTWLILAIIVIALAGSGFVLGRIFAGSSSPESAQASTESKKESKKEGGHGAKKEGKKEGSKEERSSSYDTWYFNGLESVVVNPDEPGATRYVRVGLTIEFGAELGKEEVSGLIEAKKPLLINWLNLYFKSLTLNQMQNDRDMKHILSQICDAFNEILFPNAKPEIKKILIREFNIQ